MAKARPFMTEAACAAPQSLPVLEKIGKIIKELLSFIGGVFHNGCPESKADMLTLIGSMVKSLSDIKEGITLFRKNTILAKNIEILSKMGIETNKFQSLLSIEEGISHLLQQLQDNAQLMWDSVSLDSAPAPELCQEYDQSVAYLNQEIHRLQERNFIEIDLNITHAIIEAIQELIHVAQGLGEIQDGDKEKFLNILILGEGVSVAYHEKLQRNEYLEVGMQLMLFPEESTSCFPGYLTLGDWLHYTADEDSSWLD